jgi:hypothetical protein
MVHRWIRGLAKRLGVTGDEILRGFIVLTDRMSEGDPEVVRLLTRLGEVADGPMKRAN